MVVYLDLLVWFVPKPALILLSCGSTKVDLGIRSLNGQNACIGACHVGNQWQLALQLFTELLADRSGQPLQDGPYPLVYVE